MHLALFLSQKEVDDKGTMGVAAQTRYPEDGADAVAEKQPDGFLFREKDRRRIKRWRWTERGTTALTTAHSSLTSGHGRGRYPATWRDMSCCPCCLPPWRRCRGGKGRATSESAMVRGGSWTNAAPCTSRAGFQRSRASAWGDASVRCCRATATIVPSRLATQSWLA